MRIIVDVPEYLVERARQLISTSRYRDLSSFVAASMENQLSLEARPLGNESDLEPEGAAAAVFEPRPVLPFAVKLGLSSSMVPAVPYPQEPEVAEPASWPWGQINKLLPVKFAARLLAKSVSDSEPFVPLADFRQESAKLARAFGQQLRDVDDRLQHEWGDRLSAGFPISRRAQSSLDRYANHFVGSYRESDGRRFGALFELQFANVRRDGMDTFIGLTSAGVEFAKAENPIIDRSDIAAPLGEAEIDFYLRHIEERVHGECQAFRLIIGLIAGGVTRRADLSQEIRRRVPFEWTARVAETYRAGTMSRMFDLNLLRKDKEGVTVEYGTSDRGLQWYRAHSN